MKSPRRTSSGSLETAVIVVIAVLAGIYGVMVLATGAFGVAGAIASETITVPQPTSVDIAPDTGEGTLIIEGTFRTADITVAGATDLARTFLALSRAFDVVTQLAVVLTVILLCIALVRRRPFMRAMVRTLIASSFALVIGGMLTTALLGFTTMEIAHSLDRPGFPMMAELDFTALFFGLGLALVATAFAAGERLQRDTEGLV